MSAGTIGRLLLWEPRQSTVALLPRLVIGGPHLGLHKHSLTATNPVQDPAVQAVASHNKRKTYMDRLPRVRLANNKNRATAPQTQDPTAMRILP